MKQWIDKPILTIEEAAALLSVTPKRMNNIVYEEKRRLGRMPDFVCDAGGVISTRIVRDRFLDWAKNPARVRRSRRAVRSAGRRAGA